MGFEWNVAWGNSAYSFFRKWFQIKRHQREVDARTWFWMQQIIGKTIQKVNSGCLDALRSWCSTGAAAFSNFQAQGFLGDSDSDSEGEDVEVGQV